MKNKEKGSGGWRGLGGLVMALTAGLMAAQPLVADQTVAFELETATMDDIQQAMEAGALTSVELALLYLNRIEAYDKNGIKLNTVPAINPRLIPEAARADRLRANGEKLGPLQGIPFTAKGSFNFEGLPNTDGLNVWADLFPKESCSVIKTLQEKGAVFLGHANLDVFQGSTTQANSQVWGERLTRPSELDRVRAVAASEAAFDNPVLAWKQVEQIRNPQKRSELSQEVFPNLLEVNPEMARRALGTIQLSQGEIEYFQDLLGR